ncbi:general transcriptional corepressor trfA-like [Hyperolius riggenbachi]|uniref:general transcriptional corepressor trfA-like n=1 Tax=Hyperolius riggenbachi TaxID=752182 RepID=UPI0035A3A4D9
MEEEPSHKTERILNLTLEIIYLLTGEDYEVVKKTSGELLSPRSLLHDVSLTTVPPSHPLSAERKETKILDVIRKMIELLTGEDKEKSHIKEEETHVMIDERTTEEEEGGTMRTIKEEETHVRIDERTTTEEEGGTMRTIKEEETHVRIDERTTEEEEGGTMRTIKEEETCVRIDQRTTEDASMMGTIKREEEMDARSDLLSTQDVDMNEMSMNLTISQPYQVKEEETDVRIDKQTTEEEGGTMRPIKEEPTDVMIDQLTTEEEGSTMRRIKEEESDVMLDQQTIKEEGGTMRPIKEEETDVMIDQRTAENASMMGPVKMEEEMDVRSDLLAMQEVDVNGMSLDISTGPLYSQDGTQKASTILYPYQGEEIMPVKVEIKEEETYVMIDQQATNDVRMTETIKREDDTDVRSGLAVKKMSLGNSTDGKTQPGPSSTAQEPPRKKTREEMIEELHAKMRQMSGQDQPPTPSFPENPIRDPNNPDHYDDWDRHKMGHTQWCSCNNCTPMSTGMASICCREIPSVNARMENIPCITNHPMFAQLCLNEEWAKIFLFLINICKGFKPSKKKRRYRITRKSLRRAVYSAFTGWVHQQLGEDDRRPIPSCVVMKVREVFPGGEKKTNRHGVLSSGDLAAESMVWEWNF